MTDSSSLSPEYVAARRVLLDALFLMQDQIDALVLVGAQAVYLRAPLGDSRPTFTTDADLAIDPDLLARVPDLGHKLSSAGFVLDEHGNPGHWYSPDGIVVDLMVPAGSLPTSSRRTAPLDGQDRRTARSTRGLEVSLYDNSLAEIAALDKTDLRTNSLRVAGPAALVIAKSVKIRERLDAANPGRVITKDAGDLLRWLRNSAPTELGARLSDLSRHDRLRDQIADVIAWLRTQFDGERSTPMLRLVSQELEGIESAVQSERSLRLLGRQLLSGYDDAEGVAP